MKVQNRQSLNVPNRRKSLKLPQSEYMQRKSFASQFFTMNGKSELKYVSLKKQKEKKNKKSTSELREKFPKRITEGHPLKYWLGERFVKEHGEIVGKWVLN